MLNQLKLLHTYLGSLIEQAESGTLKVTAVSHARTLDTRSGVEDLNVTVHRNVGPVKTCDHLFRRIASGEYECSKCGTITDDVENEQWA